MGILDWLKKGAVPPRPDDRPEPGESEPEPERQPVLPSCDDLFVRFFDRWYSDEDRKRNRRNGAVRPDMERCAAPGTPVSGVSALTADSGRQVVEFLKGLAAAAAGAPGKIDLAWIQGFDAFYDRREIARMLESADPGDRRNLYAMTCQGFAAVLGEVLVARMPGCAWLPQAPTWESAIYDPRGGVRVNVFDWSVKKLSEYGVDDGVAMKIEVCAALYENGWRDLDRR